VEPVEVRRVEVFGLTGIGEVVAGTDLAALVVGASSAFGGLRDGDIAVITSKVVSKAEGRTVELATVEPSQFARDWAARWGKDPAVTELVLREASRVVRQVGPILITETHHGFVCANSGVDQSSSGAAGRAVLLPLDPDASARRVRDGFRRHGFDVAVVVSDTFGRAWREGQTDIAIGIAGIRPITSYIGQQDPHGHTFRVQALCVVDELAGAGELVKGNVDRVPVAVVRGFGWARDEDATARSIVRSPDRDLFR
jgi:coenzyme F420-0:L-glutamate ligase/coenzyme F420-1:gamma-L-glutamate ligase